MNQQLKAFRNAILFTTEQQKTEALWRSVKGYLNKYHLLYLLKIPHNEMEVQYLDQIMPCYLIQLKLILK